MAALGDATCAAPLDVHALMKKFPRTVAALNSELIELSDSEMPHAARPSPDEVLGALVLLRLKYPDLFGQASPRVPTSHSEALVSLFDDESDSVTSDSNTVSDNERESRCEPRLDDCASDASSVPDIDIDMAGGEHASATAALGKPGDLLRSIANIFSEEQHNAEHEDSAAHVAFHEAHSEPAHFSAFEGGDSRSVLSSLTAVEAFADSTLSWHAKHDAKHEKA